MSQGNEGKQALLELSYMCTFPMAVKAAILLQVPEILSTASTPLTAKQIADRIPGSTTSEGKLDRLLYALATHGLFEVSGTNPRAYTLNAVSKMLLKDEKGMSLAPMFLLNTQISQLQTMHSLHEAILDDSVIPFQKAYGQPVFQYMAQNPQLGEIFHSTMTNLSAILMKSILQSYDGFKDVKILVDVGGGFGLNCTLIKAAYPHISAINFDMPFVVGKAPTLPGIEHRGGNMLEAVPIGGDTILLKTVLHNWDDESCGKILRNCYGALPSYGKLIIIEAIVPDKMDTTSTSRLVASFDLTMMTIFSGGKERTANQFQQLVESVGFKDFKVMHRDVLSIIESYKID